MEDRYEVDYSVVRNSITKLNNIKNEMMKCSISLSSKGLLPNEEGCKGQVYKAFKETVSVISVSERRLEALINSTIKALEHSEELKGINKNYEKSF